MSDLERALRFLRGSVELVAEEVRRIEEGWTVRTPSLPAVWFLNHVRLEQPVSYERAVELTDRHLAGEPYRQLFVEEGAGGEALAERFRADGWEVDVEVHMSLAREPDRLVDLDAVIEGDEEELLGLMARWLREDETLHVGEEGMAQLVESNRRTWRARDARHYGVTGADGSTVAMTLLFSDGAVGQVEDVYTIPEARKLGYARALVTRAAADSRRLGHEFTFIVADDNDWPKQLYGKVGFEPLGRTWLFHRDLERDLSGSS